MYCWCCLIVTIKILVVLFFFFLWLVLRRRAGGWAGVVQCLLLSASVSWYVQTNPPTKFPAPAAHDTHALANLLHVATSVRPCV